MPYHYIEKLILVFHLLGIGIAFGSVLYMDVHTRLHPKKDPLLFPLHGHFTRFCLGLIFLTGFALFYMQLQMAIQARISFSSARYWILGIKLLLLVLLGVCMESMRYKIERGEAQGLAFLRVASLTIVPMATFLGTLLRMV